MKKTIFLILFLAILILPITVKAGNFTFDYDASDIPIVLLGEQYSGKICTNGGENVTFSIEATGYQSGTDSEGFTYTYDVLPEGLTLNSDGTITGVVSAVQAYDSYHFRIVATKGESTIKETASIYVANSGGANFDNIYEETGYINYNSSDTYYTKDGFLVFDQTLSNYISYNSDTKTYNITLTQDFENNSGNYIEFVFKESEYKKVVKYEILENEGFEPMQSIFYDFATYPYYKGELDIYSIYSYADVDLDYTGNNRHLYFKISNPEDSIQFRYANFNIIDNNNLFVAFESNGGSIINTIETIVGETITKPKDPTKNGYKFVGWYTEEELENEFDFTQEITTNTILYAKWEEVKATEFVESKNNITFTTDIPLPILYVLVSNEITDNSDIDTINNKLIGKKLLSVYDIYFKDSKNQVVNIGTGTYVIKIKITDEMKKYSKFQVVYLNDEGQIEETFHPEITEDYLIFTTTHLSKYGVIGLEEKDDTPRTGNSSYSNLIAITLFVSSIGIVAFIKK